MATLASYGVVGDGVTDDTAALQSAINAEGSPTSDPNKTYLISSPLNFNQTFSHDIDWNGSTIIHNAVGNLIDIDKRGGSNRLTKFSNLTIDGDDIVGRGIHSFSRTHLDNVTVRNITAGSATAVYFEVYDDAAAYGNWIIENSLIHDVYSNNNNGTIGDGDGAANGYIVYWRALPTQAINLILRDSTIHSCWGEDSQCVATFSPNINLTNSLGTNNFENLTLYDAQRRIVKAFTGNHTWRNCTIRSAHRSNVNLVPGAPAGMFSMGPGSLATGGGNNLVEGCTFSGPVGDIMNARDKRVILIGDDYPTEATFNNCIFEGHSPDYNSPTASGSHSGLGHTGHVGDVTICGCEFRARNIIYDYNSGSGTPRTDVGEITIGNNNTYIESPGIVFEVFSHVLADLNCATSPTLYVSTIGSDTNDGLTEGNSFRTIQKAVDTATAGTTIYVKAGNYGAEKVSSVVAGTSTNPIKIVGYLTTPGDIIASNGPTYTYDNWLSNSSVLPNNVMPHIEFSPVNNNPASTDVGFKITHPYIEIHNFMVSNAMEGWDIEAANVTLDNCIGDQFGNWDPNATGWNATSDSGSYTHRNGYGIHLSGADNFVIKNSLIIDAGFVGYFIVSSNFGSINNCVGVAENTGNGSDYIFDLYNSSDNTLDNITARRTYTGSLGHKSRAITTQGPNGSHRNVITNLTAENLRIQCEYSDGNVYDGVTIKTVNGGAGENDGSIQIGPDANSNIFKNFTMTGGGGIQFLGYETSDGGATVNTAGSNNYFINFIIKDIPANNGNGLVSFNRLGNTGVGSGPNYIIGLTAYNFPWIINANRDGEIHFYNCTFSNSIQTSIDTFYTGFPDFTSSYVVSYTNCNFFGNDFVTPTGTNIIEVDPKFADAPNGSFQLLSNSPLINQGMDASTLTLHANKDFIGTSRPQSLSYDIGAYEKIINTVQSTNKNTANNIIIHL